MYSAALRYILRSVRRNSHHDKCSATESLCAHDKFSRFSTHYMMLLIQGRRPPSAAIARIPEASRIAANQPRLFHANCIAFQRKLYSCNLSNNFTLRPSINGATSARDRSKTLSLREAGS
jgi:hypothetical protein